MSVARDDLRGDGLGREPHLLADVFLDPWVDIREGADRAGDRAGRDLAPGEQQPLLGPVELGIGAGELQPERDRLGMDPVRAADGRGHLMLEGAPLQRREEPVQVREQEVGRPHELHGEIHRVPVARHDLRRDRLRRKAQLFADIGLHPRIDIGEGADRAGDRAGRDVVARRDQPRPGAVELGISESELEPERHRLGMDAVAAADRRRQFVLVGTALEHRHQRLEILDEDLAGLLQLDRQAGVEHVRAGQALMEEARFGADLLGGPGQEGDDVMLHHRFDRIDARDVDGRLCRPIFAHPGRRFLGNRTELRHRVERVRLDLEPDAISVFRLPDRRHPGPRVAGNHRPALWAGKGARNRSPPGIRRVAGAIGP